MDNTLAKKAIIGYYTVQATKYGYWVTKETDQISLILSWERSYNKAKDIARSLNLNSKGR